MGEFYNEQLHDRQPGDRYWWDSLPEPIKIEIRPTSEQAKPPKVRPGCLMIFFAIIIRIYCFLAGILMLAYGGWILYSISANLSPLPILSDVARGGFEVLSGLLTVLVETRTRRTFQRCLNTYVFVSNYFTRGVFYLIVGGLTYPVGIAVPFIGTFGDSRLFGGFIAAGGVISLIYAPFRYRHLRRKTMASHAGGIPFAEEIVYELNAVRASEGSTPSDTFCASANPEEIEQKITVNEGTEFDEIDLEKARAREEMNKDILTVKIAPSGGIPVM